MNLTFFVGERRGGGSLSSHGMYLKWLTVGISLPFTTTLGRCSLYLGFPLRMWWTTSNLVDVVGTTKLKWSRKRNRWKRHEKRLLSHPKRAFLAGDNRVFNGSLCRSVCLFASIAHSAHSLRSSWDG